MNIFRVSRPYSDGQHAARTVHPCIQEAIAIHVLVVYGRTVKSIVGCLRYELVLSVVY